MNKKQTIRLNESQFNNLVENVVKESVDKVLNESKFENIRSALVGARNAYRVGRNFDNSWDNEKRSYSETGGKVPQDITVNTKNATKVRDLSRYYNSFVENMNNGVSYDAINDLKDLISVSKILLKSLIDQIEG